MDDSDKAFGLDTIEPQHPTKKERKIYSDQPGRFPKKSSHGNQYIMVLTEVDSDAILVEPMKNRTAREMIRAYQVLQCQFCLLRWDAELKPISSQEFESRGHPTPQVVSTLGMNGGIIRVTRSTSLTLATPESVTRCSSRIST